jgi:filamentous hemagglutinin family protein
MDPSRLAAGVSLLLLPALPARAQVVLDGTIKAGGPIPLVGGEYAITDELGSYSGADNLFFSFGDPGGVLEPGQSGFDIRAGETAHFSASLGTPERVIARVTSGVRSKINGLVRSTVLGPDGTGADLFLLNGSGISFGDGADLDVQGSFYASTADVLRFEEGPDLIVGDPAPPVLSTAAPAAFGFTSAGVEKLIDVQRARSLSVPVGDTLSFVGGDAPGSPAGVLVTGRSGVGVADVIAAPGATLEIAAAAGPVDIPVKLTDLDLGAVDPALLGRVKISTSAKVNLSGVGETPAGRVVIRGGHFALESNAQILARNDSGTAAVGPVDIAVTGDLELRGSNSQIQSFTAGTGRAGEVLLSGDRVRMSEGADLSLVNGSLGGEGPDAMLSGRVVALDTGAEIRIRGASSGRASSVGITASESIEIEDGASVVSDLLREHSGAAGVITLDSPAVSVAGDAQVSTLNRGTGAGARIEVFADELAVDDGAGIVSTTDASGAGGLVHLEVGSLAVTRGGRVASDTTRGPGGTIEVLADRVFVSNENGPMEGTFVAAKNGGEISIEAGRVELAHGGQIRTTTEGSMPAGTLLVREADLVSASGLDADRNPSGLFSRSSTAATADGGLLSVETRILEVDDGAELSSSTSGAGDAGPMDLRASERMSVRGGPGGFALVSASAAPGSTGSGGTLEIHADLLELRDGGQVTTSTFGPGDAGSVEAHARIIEISGVDPITPANPSAFFSRSGGAGDGGTVDLRATQSVSMSDGARISTSSSDSGLAGDILVEAGERLEMRDSLITTQADRSAGGNVKIGAAELVYLYRSAIETLVVMGEGGGGDVTIDPVHTVLNESHVKASAVGGPGGNILIDTDFYFQSGESFLDASSREDVAGVIEVTAPETDLANSLATLPARYLDASSQLERECAARTTRAGSFVVRTREAALAPPDAALHAAEAEAGSCPGARRTP